jgi:3-carboxy-cis,cis-muconate cycloisomerase
VSDALRSEQPLAEALAGDPVVATVLDRNRIDELLDPAGYLGVTTTWIDRAIAARAKEASP